MTTQNTPSEERPTFSALGVRPAGIALHTSNHATSLALSAWK